LIHVATDKSTYKIDMKAMESQINGNTICIVGSAPNFCQGTIDDIPALGALALKYRIGLHVDACMGGYLIPFAKLAGFEMPPIDFQVPGVTSISCDIHKFGCTPKGISVLMWKNTEMRKY
jgi:sphinganine-1-phosphate aldolase